MVIRQISSRRKASHGSQGPVHSNRQTAMLNLTALPPDKLVRLLRRGFSYKTLIALSAASGIPEGELAAIIEIPERTLARRRIAGKLRQDESERLLRLANVMHKAVQLFEGDVRTAVAWLRTPQKALSYNAPLSYARFEVGAQAVQDLIGRLEHGVFS